MSYSLLVNGVPVSVPGGNTVSNYTVTGLPAGVPATVAIAVQNSNGVGPYSSVECDRDTIKQGYLRPYLKGICSMPRGSDTDSYEVNSDEPYPFGAAADQRYQPNRQEMSERLKELIQEGVSQDVINERVTGLFDQVGRDMQDLIRVIRQHENRIKTDRRCVTVSGFGRFVYRCGIVRIRAGSENRNAGGNRDGPERRHGGGCSGNGNQRRHAGNYAQ